MVTITIDNSMSRITGLLPQQEKALREALSYEVDSKAAYFSKQTWNRKKCMIDKKGNFPTGLLERAVDSLGRGVFEIIEDVRRKPRLKASSGWKGVPYSSQIEAVKEAEYYERGTISMPTGTGKSFVIAMIAARLNVTTLVVVPSLEIKKQLTLSLIASLNDTSKIVVENIDSPRLKTLTDFGCLIIDEAHHVAAKTYQKLNKTAWKGIYYRFFLTATPFRNNSEETLLFEAIAGQVIYQLSYKDAVSEGYIVPIEGYYLESPKKATDAYTWAQVYSELVVNNKDRNDLIASLLGRLTAPTLCLVREVKHGKILSSLTGVPFVSGEDEESRDYIRQFNEGRIDRLIGTTAIIGEGIDTKPCEYVIIAGAGKAKSQFMQQVGRAVRRYPGKDSAKVILVRDNSHKFLTRHFNAQRAILRTEYGVECLKLEVS